MMRSLYTASTGMYAQQLHIDTLAHNMSNVNTTGFKKQRAEFQDIMYQTIRRPTTTAATIQPVGTSVGLGVKTAAINTLFGQGPLQATENPLDVAINGDAFFCIEVPNRDEPLYSRDGAIKIDAEGNLVTADGFYYLGVDPMLEDGYEPTIARDGTVSCKVPDTDEEIEMGRLELVKFANPAGLQRLGNNLYAATENSGEALYWDPEMDPTVTLESGYLEMSNVKIVEEMVNLITAQRAYEINSKVIQASDEMLQTATNLRR